MSDKTLTVTTRQAAVGQGGLMTADVVLDSAGYARRLAYAFDCGSFNRERLYQAIESIGTPFLDILFISHLDADHVNGVDLLLAKRHVETVILPCLDALSATVIVCRALSGVGLTGDFEDFLDDPVRWLGVRGVKRVVFIKRDGGVEPMSPGGQPPDLDPDSRYWVDTVNEEDPRIAVSIASRGIRQSAQRRQLPSGQVEVLVAQAEVEIELVVGAAVTPPEMITWILLPYVHPFEEDSIELFRAAVRGVLRVPDGEKPAARSFMRRLLKCLVDPSLRAKLRACYGVLASDHNEVSLSLYSGPRPSNNDGWDIRGTSRWFSFDRRYGGPIVSSRFRVPPQRFVQPRPAWLCTGDANLKLQRTRGSWLTRFGPLLEQVGVFVLPHHGSALNLSDEILDGLRDAAHIVCAGASRERHPHPDVLGRFSELGLGLWQVSEQEESVFGMTVSR